MRLLMAMIVATATLIGCTRVGPAPADIDPLNAAPDVVGRALRSAIDAEYARLIATRTFKMPSMMITSTVERYIPVGSTFERAEAVLESAGLTIDPSRTYGSLWPDSYALRGKIIPYPEGWQIFPVCRQTLSIVLSPQAEMHLGSKRTIDPATVDWSQIRRVEASISNICL